jgi:hypothetical protein
MTLVITLRSMGRRVIIADSSKGCIIDPLNAELNPIHHLLALAGAHHFVDVSRIKG